MLKSCILCNRVCRWVSTAVHIFYWSLPINTEAYLQIFVIRLCLYPKLRCSVSLKCSFTWLCVSASGWTSVWATELYSTLLSLTGFQPLHLTLLLCSGLWPLGNLNCLSFDPAVTAPVGGGVLSQLWSRPEKRQEDGDGERERSGHTVGVTELSFRKGPVGLAGTTWQCLICYMIWPPRLQQSLI